MSKKRKIDPVLGVFIAIVAFMVCYCGAIGTTLSGFAWLTWRDFNQSRKPASMILIPAGEFRMGSVDSDTPSFDNEKPQHTVYLDDFWIDKQKVTNLMYSTCAQDGGCQGSSIVSPEYNDYPKTSVTWQEARDYCLWAGRDLPTEAQWEKAARGTDGRIYPWGDTIDCTLANYGACKHGGPTETGSYPKGASPYGVLDMTGNVWEWVLDWYDANYYSYSALQNPAGPQTGQLRIARGGSWLNGAGYVRAAYRFTAEPDHYYGYIGFRCASSTGK